METNKVVLDLETYNELLKKAIKYEEMKEKQDNKEKYFINGEDIKKLKT
ncbi:hypothetical protein [Mammaliicoccus vitulinus]|nr:hypothetical protein [Mammaliicoccus vitulinus]